MDTKQRIIETASHLFYVQGYQSTGINQIIAEANVAKGSLYNHFESKSALGQAYVRSVSENWFAGFEDALLGYDGAKEKLIGAFDFLQQYAKSNKFNGCRLINILTEIADSDEEIRILVVDHKQKFRKQLFHIASQVFEDPEKAQSVSDSLYLLYEGATVESKIYKRNWPIELAKLTAEKLLKEN